MTKVDIGRNISLYPMPVTLIGANVRGKPNFMAAAWITRANASPPMLAVSLNKPRLTAEGIRENRTFSVNFPDTKLVEETDFCGLQSGRDVDKSKIFEIFYGRLKNAPMIQECPLSIECELKEVVSLPTNDLFIGEIVGAFSEERYYSEGKLDARKLDPLLLTMPDNSYWSLGEYIGKAWSMGEGWKAKK